MIVNAKAFQCIPLGIVGENETRTIRFDVHDIIAQYPNVTFTVMNRRRNDPDAYPVSDEYVTVEDGYLLWQIQSGDLAYDGYGKVSIVAMEDEVIKKTVRYSTFVDRANDMNVTPPNPWLSWQQAIANAVRQANATVLCYPRIGENNTWEVYDVAQGVYVDTHVDARGQHGATTYVYIKYSANQPTQDSDMKSEPDAWMGVHSGLETTAPAHYTDYVWYKIKGDAGDISSKADKTDTVLNTTLSRGRVGTVGEGSIAFGVGVSATAPFGVAFGAGCNALGQFSFAHGGGTNASGDYAFAMGGGCRAVGVESFAFGDGCAALANCSFAFGGGCYAYESAFCSAVFGGGSEVYGANAFAHGANVIANGSCSHVFGAYNVPDDYLNWEEWSPKEWKVGDRVKITEYEDGQIVNIEGYQCAVANSDQVFDPFNWINMNRRMNFVEIVGGGYYDTYRNNRVEKNIRTLDFDGNEHLAGDLYVHCDGDGHGGIYVPSMYEIKHYLGVDEFNENSIYIERSLVIHGDEIYMFPYGHEKNVPWEETFSVRWSMLGEIHWVRDLLPTYASDAHTQALFDD